MPTPDQYQYNQYQFSFVSLSFSFSDMTFLDTTSFILLTTISSEPEPLRARKAELSKRDKPRGTTGIPIFERITWWQETHRSSRASPKPVKKSSRTVKKSRRRSPSSSSSSSSSSPSRSPSPVRKPKRKIQR